MNQFTVVNLERIEVLYNEILNLCLCSALRCVSELYDGVQVG